MQFSHIAENCYENILKKWLYLQCHYIYSEVIKSKIRLPSVADFIWKMSNSEKLLLLSKYMER